MTLPVTNELVAAAARRLHEGGWHYTPRQLYYATCAAAETSPQRTSSGWVGLGLVLVLIGIITGHLIPFAALAGIGVVLIVVGLIARFQEKRPQSEARVLAMSFDEFERTFIDARSRRPGLIGAASFRPAERISPETTLVVCDHLETASALQANADHLPAGVAVAIIGNLPASPLHGRGVVAVHDCDPSGCALLADLRDLGAEAVDAGLNPGDVIGHRVQLIEGAPARLTRDLDGELQPEEIEWLRSGKRVEVATLTPEELVLRVRTADARLRCS